MDYDPIKILSELVACKSLTPDTDGVLEVLDNYLKPMQFSSKTLGKNSLQKLFKNSKNSKLKTQKLVRPPH